MKKATDILKLLTKDELIECLLNKYVIMESLRYSCTNEKAAASIVIDILRERQIKSNNEQLKKLENRPKCKTTEEFLRMIAEDEKHEKEYKRIEKQIKKLEKII